MAACPGFPCLSPPELVCSKIARPRFVGYRVARAKGTVKSNHSGAPLACTLVLGGPANPRGLDLHVHLDPQALNKHENQVFENHAPPFCR